MRSKLEHSTQATGLKIAIIVSSYHSDVTSKLLDGAQTTFIESGGTIDDCQSITVSGAWELPVVASAIATKGEVDAIVALGCIISGETTHDQVIADAIAEGLMNVSVQWKQPVSMGVLTCKTLHQAHDRAGGEGGNKGSEAMYAALSTIAVMRDVR
jgi:6,7-dimethyl-8-ribityllumazine synthase